MRCRLRYALAGAVVLGGLFAAMVASSGLRNDPVVLPAPVAPARFLPPRVPSPSWESHDSGDGGPLPGGTGAVRKEEIPPLPTSAIDIWGTVLSMERNQPIAGARLVVSGVETTTDERGGFLVERIPLPFPGRHWLQVRAEGFESGFLWLDDGRLGSPGGVNVWLGPAHPASGRVVDEDGNPVAGALIAIEDRGTLLDGAESDAAGRFHLPGAGRRTFQVRAWPPEDGGEWDPGALVSCEGGSQDIELVLRRAPRISCRVIVTLRDAGSARPLEATECLLLPTGGTAAVKPPVHVPSPVAKEGRVFFHGVRPGTWALWTRTGAGGPVRTEFTIDPGESSREMVVEVEPGGSVRGRVDLPADALDLPLHVWLEGPWPEAPRGAFGLAASAFRAQQRLESDGSFRFDGVMTGTLAVVLQGPGWEGREQFQVHPGGTTDVLIAARPLGRVRFRMEGPCPSGSLVLSMTEGEGPEIRHRFQAAGGKEFSWEKDVRPGSLRWELRIGTEDGPPSDRGELVVAAGEEREIVLGRGRDVLE